MTEKKKVIKKTVNRTGKSLVKKALVVKAKKQSKVTAENIRKLNEKVLQSRINKEKNRGREEGVETKNVEEVKADKKYDLTIDVKDLLLAGCHLGHKVSKTHPKAREFIYSKKDGIEVIDLMKSIAALEKACNYIYNLKRNGKQVVLVGTKRQAREVVRRVALDAGVPYVIDRWLGGTITNWEQIRKNIKKLNELKEGLEKGKFAESTKKELSLINKEIVRLEKIVGGLSNLEKLFDAIVVVDAGFERTAIKEAKIRKIKTIAVTDTDMNPFIVDLPISANDDSAKSITVIIEEIGRAIKAAGVK